MSGQKKHCSKREGGAGRGTHWWPPGRRRDKTFSKAERGGRESFTEASRITQWTQFWGPSKAATSAEHGKTVNHTWERCRCLAPQRMPETHRCLITHSPTQQTAFHYTQVSISTRAKMTCPHAADVQALQWIQEGKESKEKVRTLLFHVVEFVNQSVKSFPLCCGKTATGRALQYSAKRNMRVRGTRCSEPTENYQLCKWWTAVWHSKILIAFQFFLSCQCDAE